MQSLAKALPLLMLLGTSSAHASEMLLHVLWDARVVEVDCHALVHEGHDYSIGGTAKLVGRNSSDGKKRTLLVVIAVARLEDPGEAENDSQYLCRELTAMKESSKTADVLWSVIRSNLSRPVNAIRAITKLRGCDENNRTGNGE